MDLNDVDPRAFQSLLKSGGKKKLDALLELVIVNGPQRIQELLDTDNVSEAHAAARGLKNSAAILGLNALEDSCDQILASKIWKIKHPLAIAAKGQLSRGLAVLAQARQGI